MYDVFCAVLSPLPAVGETPPERGRRDNHNILVSGRAIISHGHFGLLSMNETPVGTGLSTCPRL
jgi:hypothetical protein